MNSSEDKIPETLRRWYARQSPLWLSSKIGGWAVAVSCVISELNEDDLTLSFNTVVTGAGLSGSLFIPFGKMLRQYFEHATDAPFEPPAHFDGPMLSCVEFKFEGYNHFVICELKNKLT